MKLTSKNLRLPSIFGDYMVLQQETAVPVWGWASSGEQITVMGSWGEKSVAVANDDGKWMVCLPTPSYGGPYSLTIQGRDKITINHVMIGEVWLCAGQSNLGWRLSATFEGEVDGAQANYPHLRIFRSERAHHHEPQDDCDAEWKPCTPESAGTCSAVSFYFAEKLYCELEVPVGIVIQPYAGTPIEGWMPKAVQEHDVRTANLIREMDAESESYDLEEAERRLEVAMARWKAGVRKAKPVLGRPSNQWHQYPGNIYNGMIHPIRPYGIRGAIWYQGERNAKDVAQAAHYVHQLPMLIDYYRSSWHEMSEGHVAKDFPFYFVQLPSWFPRQTEPVEANAPWAVSREMMRLVAESVPNTGMAVSIDTGDEILLHPLDKKPIGLRLAYLALKETYDKDFVASGPIFRDYKIEGDRIVLTFDSVGSGLMCGKDGALDGFAVAGEDRKFVWADAVIKGHTVVVCATRISNPVAVRYAWAMNPSCQNLLYNKEGIPASPFRTDTWPLFDEADNLDALVNSKKPEGYHPVEFNRPQMTQ